MLRRSMRPTKPEDKMAASTADTTATNKNKLNATQAPMERAATAPQTIQNPAAPTAAPPVAHLIRVRDLLMKPRSTIATKRLAVSTEERLTATPIPTPDRRSVKNADQPPYSRKAELLPR